MVGFPLGPPVSSLSTLIHSEKQTLKLKKKKKIKNQDHWLQKTPNVQPTVTIESLPGSDSFRGDPNPHGSPDVSRFLAAMGQVGVELLWGAANHRLES